MTNARSEDPPRKRCGHCDLSLRLSEFGRSSRSPDGLYRWCRECANLRQRYRYKHGHGFPVQPKKVRRVYDRAGQLRCRACGETKPIATGFWVYGPDTARPGYVMPTCRECLLARRRG